jgi:hypothetical protein
LNNAIVTQSDFQVRKVYQEIRRYVQSGAYPRALAMLGEDRIVVLAGAPGVGKTTLANLLLYEHLEKGYQAIVIQRDIEEGQRLIQDGIEQIYYFDDFMGATFLGDQVSSISRNEDKAILEFVAMVRANPKARLVLTTREHIFSQALTKSERLRHSEISDFRVPIRMNDYSFGQRAQILYNHLYFSDLPPEYQDELLRNEFYFTIVKHEKFNPRLIDWLSTYRRLKNVPADQYRNFVSDLLRDPSEIWRHAYEQQISDAGRSLLLALFSLGGKASGFLLKPAFNSLHEKRSLRYGFVRRPEDFRSALRELAGSFIKPSSAHAFDVIDPSVLDLLNAVCRDVPENAVDIVRGASSFAQIERIWSFAKAEKGAPVALALSEEVNEIADAIKARLYDSRKIDMGQGAFGYMAPTYEKRLCVLIDMSEHLRASRLAQLIPDFCDHLFEEWQKESLNISDTVDVLRSFDHANSGVVGNTSHLIGKICVALMEEAGTGCRSDELRDIISVIDTAKQESRQFLLNAFTSYREQYFGQELSECRSSEQYDGLIEDLTLFQTVLGVDTKILIARTADEKDQFEEHQEEYADQMHDEWKERGYEEWSNDAAVRDMFGSLKFDR